MNRKTKHSGRQGANYCAGIPQKAATVVAATTGRRVQVSAPTIAGSGPLSRVPEAIIPIWKRPAGTPDIPTPETAYLGFGHF